MGESVREYSFGQKNNWRRRVWNRIAGLAGERWSSGLADFGSFPCVGDMRVLFMPGPSCEDVPVALAKGFRKKNLVAVDSDEQACRQARKTGILAVRGDLSSVLHALDEDDAFDVIFADLCTNVSRSLHAFVLSVIISRARRTPLHLIVNTLRGRETKPYAEALAHHKSYMPEMKHRGVAVHALILHALQQIGLLKDQLDFPRFCARHWLDTYASSTQRMDSIGLLLNLPASRATSDFDKQQIAAARRSLAAARAVYTMQSS